MGLFHRLFGGQRTDKSLSVEHSRPEKTNLVKTSPPSLPKQSVKPKSTKIEITEEFKSAIELIESNASPIFITGNAGSGKSTLLAHIKDVAKKNTIVLAPTGMAAINVRGVTIHSFFKFAPKMLQRKDIQINRARVDLFRKIDLLIIDEVSMVRADLLDAIDMSLQLHRASRKPFGGVQVVLIGDVCQLPPVVREEDLKEYFSAVYETPFFFSSKVLVHTGLHVIELTKIFRQSDPQFISVLNKIRKAEADMEDLITINERYVDSDEAKKVKSQITLSTTNSIADTINRNRLSELPEPQYCSEAIVTGKAKGKDFPAPEELTIRKGAQIMMVKNKGMLWVNGTIGKIVDFAEKEIKVEVPGGTHTVTKEQWDVIDYKFDRSTGRVEEEVVGTFTQFPIRLAWAITIHKSQGQSFDKVSIDMGSGAFAHGQLYVALSRCRSLEGISMRTPVDFTDLCFDERVRSFVLRTKNPGFVQLAS